MTMQLLADVPLVSKSGCCELGGECLKSTDSVEKLGKR
jgi:hypothetical protein